MGDSGMRTTNKPAADRPMTQIRQIGAGVIRPNRDALPCGIGININGVEFFTEDRNILNHLLESLNIAAEKWKP